MIFFKDLQDALWDLQPERGVVDWPKVFHELMAALFCFRYENHASVSRNGVYIADLMVSHIRGTLHQSKVQTHSLSLGLGKFLRFFF